MLKFLQTFHPFVFVLIATLFEASGDAIIRTAIYNHVGMARIVFLLAGAALLFAYGCALNLAPLEFGHVVGLYVAVLFVVFQITNFIAFKTAPTLPVVIGGAFIIAGGCITVFWKQ